MLESRRIGVVVAVGSLALSASAVFGGDLAPPAGPVTPTMKDLDDVEPRTAINSTNTPGDADSVFRITQPGSYYLTGNVVGPAGSHGIEIDSDQVTLDLNGFRVFGNPGSLDGVNFLGRDDVIIRNGTIHEWDGDGINGNGAIGGLIEDVVVSRVGGVAIRLEFSFVVSNCVISECINGAIDVNCCVLVHGCQFGTSGISANQFAIFANQNVTVRGCTFNNCGSFGGAVISIGNEGVVANNTISFCSGDGILTGSESLITGNLVDASQNGIEVNGNNNRVEGNHVKECDFGYLVTGTANLVIRNYATDNTTEYSIGAGNMFGPIVTIANIGVSNNPHANYQF